ncbi:hypothetical protein ACBR40_33355 [Nonomuraea sp. AD125B]|uniref:hypothetical protein n=1 Tax=Nonomuraea sp. AD125B TaxID=3242897 RepID=UPI003529171F
MNGRRRDPAPPSACGHTDSGVERPGRTVLIHPRGQAGGDRPRVLDARVRQPGVGEHPEVPAQLVHRLPAGGRNGCRAGFSLLSADPQWEAAVAVPLAHPQAPRHSSVRRA